MMMLKIAFRNIFREKRRALLTVLTMFGGFTLSSMAIGWSDGTYAYVINMFTRNQLGHIQVHREGYLDRPSLYRTIDDYESVGAVIGGVPKVESWAPRLYCAGLASVGERSSGARVIGLDPEREQATTRFDKKIVKGRSFQTAAAHEAILGRGLAKTLKASIGAEVVIVSQAADGSIANDVYTIVGLAASEDQAANQSALYLHLRDAQELFVLSGRIHEIAVVAEGLDVVADVAGGITAAIDNPVLVVAPWQEFARSFYLAMQVDRQGTWIMLAVIMLVVAVGVLNTVLMTVLERTREYGLLRAVGTGPAQVFRLVLAEVAIMAVFGVILGLGASYVVNYGLSVKGIGYGTTITYGGMAFDRMYSAVTALSFYLPALCVVVSAMLVSIFPAIKAARVAPAKAMRTH